MNITINQILPQRENGEIVSVRTHFQARTADGMINLSGSIPVNNFSDKIDFEAIENEVRQEVVNRIINGDSSDGEESAE